MSTQLKNQIEDTGAQKLWGKHSLTLGELIGFAIGGYIIYSQKLGSKSTLVGLAIIFITEALF